MLNIDNGRMSLNDQKGPDTFVIYLFSVWQCQDVVQSQEVVQRLCARASRDTNSQLPLTSTARYVLLACLDLENGSRWRIDLRLPQRQIICTLPQTCHHFQAVGLGENDAKCTKLVQVNSNLLDMTKPERSDCGREIHTVKWVIIMFW